MTKVPGAGELNHRLSFDQRVPIDDGFGNTDDAGDWAHRFTVSAALRPRGGTEAVVAARLAGQNLVGVYVRSSANTRGITAGWRVRDKRGVEYAVVHADPVTDRAWVYLDIRSGRAP